MKLTICMTLILCLGSIYSTLAAESATENATVRAAEKTTEKAIATDLARASQKTKLAEKSEPEERRIQEDKPASGTAHKNAKPASYSYSQPSYAYSKPSSYGYSQPSYGYSRPTSYSYSQPSYGYSKPPSYSYSQPSYGYSKPSSYSYSQPSYGYSKPSSYSYSQPSYGYSRPTSYSYSQPSYGYSKPSYGYSRPTSYSYSQPSYGYSKPSSYSYSQPSYGHSQPASYSYSQPSYNYAKPSYSAPAHAPVVYAPKPIYPAIKPVIKPVIKPAVPLVVPTPVITVPKPVIIPSPAPAAISHGGLGLGGYGLLDKLSLNGGHGLGGLGLGGYGLGNKLPLDGGYGLGGLGHGGLGLSGLGGLGSKLPLGGHGLSPTFVIAPAAPAIGYGKCPTIGLLKYRQAQLQEAMHTSKRSCGFKNDELLTKFDAADDENPDDLETLDRSLFSEINNSMEMALLDPTALVQFDESKRSGLCSNLQIILKTLRLIRRVLKVLLSSRTCPPITNLLRDVRGITQEKSRSIPDYDYMFDQQAFNPDQHKQNSDLVGPENYKMGIGGLGGIGGIGGLGGLGGIGGLSSHGRPPSYLPYQQAYRPNLFQQQNSHSGYPRPYLGMGKPAKKPVVMVAPVSKPFGIGKCRAQDYLRARQEQLKETLKKTRAPKTCVLQSKDERSLLSDEMSVSSFQELALIDPFSRVELVESDGSKRNEICSNPRIILKTLSILGRLVRFLFTTDPCPPIQHLSSWILNKLDTRSLSSPLMISR